MWGQWGVPWPEVARGFSPEISTGKLTHIQLNKGRKMDPETSAAKDQVKTGLKAIIHSPYAKAFVAGIIAGSIGVIAIGLIF